MPEPQATSGDRLVAQNRKASHDYAILDTIEAGLVLAGTEVKSLRTGKASLQEAWATIENDEAFILQLHSRCEHLRQDRTGRGEQYARRLGNRRLTQAITPGQDLSTNFVFAEPRHGLFKWLLRNGPRTQT